MLGLYEELRWMVTQNCFRFQRSTNIYFISSSDSMNEGSTFTPLFCGWSYCPGVLGVFLFHLIVGFFLTTMFFFSMSFILQNLTTNEFIKRKVLRVFLFSFYSKIICWHSNKRNTFILLGRVESSWILFQEVTFERKFNQNFYLLIKLIRFFVSQVEFEIFMNFGSNRQMSNKSDGREPWRIMWWKSVMFFWENWKSKGKPTLNHLKKNGIKCWEEIWCSISIPHSKSWRFQEDSSSVPFP